MKAAFERLARKQREVIDNGFAAGNALICGGKSGIIYENYEGIARPGSGTEAGPDTVFHLYSMTKVFTAVSALQLIGREKLDLNARLSEFIPEYSDVRVLERGKMRPVEKQITVRMLLTMTSGLSYFIDDRSGEAARFADKWRELRANGEHIDTRAFAGALAGIPLSFEPGKRFLYGLSHDVLGAVIEQVSGLSLAEYFRANIFEPLGMRSTFFYQDLPEELKPKLADNTALVDGRYEAIPLLPRPVPIPAFEGIDDPAMYSGGSGLVGTARDYGRFLAEMLDPKTGILTHEMLAELTRPQLNPAQRRYYNDPAADKSIFGPEFTFGLGVSVQDKAAKSGSAGEWGWSGALGTWFFVSPEEGVWFVYMHQHSPANHGQYIRGIRDTFYDIIRREPGSGRKQEEDDDRT